MILSLKVIQVRQLLSQRKETAAGVKEEKELRLTFVSLLPGFLAARICSLFLVCVCVCVCVSDPGPWRMYTLGEAGQEEITLITQRSELGWEFSPRLILQWTRMRRDLDLHPRSSLVFLFFFSSVSLFLSPSFFFLHPPPAAAGFCCVFWVLFCSVSFSFSLSLSLSLSLSQ